MSSYINAVSFAAIVLSGVSLIYAAVSDLIRLEIANWNSILIAICFPFAALGIAMPMTEILTNFSAGLAVLVVGFILFSRGYIGGGDVKLLAALAVWAGWHSLLALVFWVAIYGGVLALLVIVARRIRWTESLMSMGWGRRFQDSPSEMPYGIAIAVGGAHVLAQLAVAGGAIRQAITALARYIV